MSNVFHKNQINCDVNTFINNKLRNLKRIVYEIQIFIENKLRYYYTLAIRLKKGLHVDIITNVKKTYREGNYG